MHNDATYYKRTTDGLVDGYSLPDEVASTLREPMIQYPNGRVPVGVARACFPQCKGALVTDDRGTVALDDLMQRFGVVGASIQARESFRERLVLEVPLLLTAAYAG